MKHETCHYRHACHAMHREAMGHEARDASGSTHLPIRGPANDHTNKRITIAIQTAAQRPLRSCLFSHTASCVLEGRVQLSGANTTLPYPWLVAAFVSQRIARHLTRTLMHVHKQQCAVCDVPTYRRSWGLHPGADTAVTTSNSRQHPVVRWWAGRQACQSLSDGVKIRRCRGQGKTIESLQAFAT
jgi:hypothetical protein